MSKFESSQAKFFNMCYEKGFNGYDAEGLKLAVKFNRITANDYKTITGVEYKA